ncbi:MAG: diguanylate cyclase [Anaerolineae bacterium]|nr:diguanylate cyclase [Anaerolineae bacterium]
MSEEGVEVQRADSLTDGMAVLEQAEIDLALLQLEPPENALEALRLLRSRFANLPVVLIGGNDCEPFALEALHCGAHEALGSDGLDVDKLLQAMRQAVERQKYLSSAGDTLQGLNEIQQNFPGIVRRYDRNLRCIYTNPAVEEALGIAPAEYLGKTDREMDFPGEWIETWESYLREVFESGQPRLVEHKMRTLKGTAHWETRISPQIAPDGTVASILAISLDITARRQAEEAFQTLVENSLQELLILQDERIVYANPAAIQNSGYGQETILQAHVRDLIQRIHPEDQAVFLDLLRTASDRTEPVRFTYRAYSPSGRLRWLDILISRIEYRGRPAFQAAQVDITELKTIEERLQRTLSDLQQVTSSISAALWMGELTPQRTIRTLYVSPVIEKVFGRPVEYFLADPVENWTRTIHSEDRRTENDLVVAAERGETEFETEYRIFLPDGEVRWIRDSVRINQQPDGKILFNGVVFDITEMKSSQEALQRANEQLQLSVKELAARNRDATLMNEMGDLLQSCLDLEEVYEVTKTFGNRLLPDHAGTLYVLNPDHANAERVAWWGEGQASLPVFHTNACWGLRRGRVHVFEEKRATPSCNHLVQSHLPVVSICAPLIAQGETLGLLYVECDHDEPADHCQQLVLTIAERAALAIATMRLQETLRMQSTRDPLTGLFNRRYMDETLARELARAERHQQSFAVVMADIDHFKLFNDSYGHQAGDVLLQGLSACLVSSVRGEDIVCRYGGEEFVIVLPEISLEKACQRMEEIRRTVSRLVVEYRGQSLGGITVSIGVAAFPLHGGDASALLLAADRALYIAKQGGRDRVVAAPFGDG